jgi:hypothetical protein
MHTNMDSAPSHILGMGKLIGLVTEICESGTLNKKMTQLPDTT